MKIKTVIWIIVFTAAATSGLSQSGQNLGQYDVLKEPRIAQMPPQKMLVVEMKGDPNVAGQQAFGLLFKVFFSIQGAKMAAPRARWLESLTTPKSDWTGLYALPVPEQASLPVGSGGARIEVWQYGDVAEILHSGSYADEAPTIQRLTKFIAEKGYAVAGPHEEEYLKGPESGPNTAEYRTIIRYQVKKK
jgi:hypothetical protein